MAFIAQAVSVLQTLVIALGAGLAVWGVINLMDGCQQYVWLFFTQDHNLDIATNTYPLDDTFLSSISEQQSAIAAYLDGESIRYLLVVPPGKPGVYPEYLPFGTTANELYTPGEKLQDYLTSHTGVRTLALRQSVLAGKADGEKVFFRTDTHWTEAGAYRGYLVMLDALPEITTAPARVSYETDYTHGDLANMISIVNSTKPEEIPCTQIVSPRAQNVTEDEEYQTLVESALAVGATTVKYFVNPALPDAPRIMTWGDSMNNDSNTATGRRSRFQMSVYPSAL